MRPRTWPRISHPQFGKPMKRELGAELEIKEKVLKTIIKLLSNVLILFQIKYFNRPKRTNEQSVVILYFRLNQIHNTTSFE